MPLTQQQKKLYKSIGHHLKPVLIVAEKGLSEGAQAELNRALTDHELIKVQLRAADRTERQDLIQELCRAGNCEQIQSIGKVVLLYRKAEKPDRHLSNIIRYQTL